MADWDDRSSGVGEIDRERGRGTWDGVTGSDVSASRGLTLILDVGLVDGLDRARDAGFFRTGDVGTEEDSPPGIGVSFTFGKPL